MSRSEADPTIDALMALLQSSLALWQCSESVRRGADGAIIVETDKHVAQIIRAAPGVPFRWSINVDGRDRVASSVTGLLRVLRIELDPDFRPSRVRIAPIEIMPP